MSLLEYEITECWKDGSQTKIKINSKPDVGAWVSQRDIDLSATSTPRPFASLDCPRLAAADSGIPGQEYT